MKITFTRVPATKPTSVPTADLNATLGFLFIINSKPKAPMRGPRITPQKPSCPTAIPKRRKRIAPSMVDIAVKKTGSVPNPFDLKAAIYQYFAMHEN